MGKDLRGRDLGKCISQRQDGRYQARFTNRFGKRESYCDYQLHLVREWLDINMAKDKLAQNVIESSITLDEWFEKWMVLFGKLDDAFDVTLNATILC